MTPGSRKSRGPGARQGVLFGPDTPKEPEESSFEVALEKAVEEFAPELGLSRIRISKRMKRTLGSYSPSKREIALSNRLVQSGDKESIREVLLHEIAHAVTHYRHPRSRPHGKEFRDVCKEIGANPARFIDVEGLSNKSEPIKYSYRCNSCGRRILRKRKTAIVRCRCGARYRERVHRSEPIRYSYRCRSCGKDILRKRRTAIVRCRCGARYRMNHSPR